MSRRGGRGLSAHRAPARRQRLRLAGVAAVACLAVVGGMLVAHLQGGGAPDRSTAAADVTPSPAPATGVPLTASPIPTPSPRTATPSHSRTPTPRARPTVRPSASASATGGKSVPSAPGAFPGGRTVTLVNRLSQTIWPAIAADPDHPVSATGWVLAPGATVTFPVPDHWDVRVWARTGCSFDAHGDGSCVTGGCGHFQCGRTWGEFPSTLAEFNLNAWNGMDFYDVSLVEGNNLPMWINSSGGSSPDKMNAKGCSAAGCTRDANASCPKALQRIRGGRVVACLSACLAFNTDRTCCTGAYSSRPACVPSSWPVDSAAVFKKAEPFAYSYVNDDATSVLTCSGECDYRITWGVSP